MDRWTDRQTDRQTYTQIPPVFYRSSSPLGLLPKKAQIQGGVSGDVWVGESSRLVDKGMFRRVMRIREWYGFKEVNQERFRLVEAVEE